MEQKTNVLIWVHDFPAISETFIRSHIVGLIDKGCQVQVYTKLKRKDQMDALKGFEEYDLYNKCISNQDLLLSNKLKRFFGALGILVSKLGRKGFFKYLKTLNFLKYGKSSLNLQNFYLLKFIEENEINIVHAHYGFMGNEAVFLKDVGAQIGLFTTFHGVDIREGLKPGKEAMYKKLFSKADRLISISKYNTESLLKMGASASKMVSLPNGIDTAYFSPKAIEETDTINILTVGRLMEVKGQDIALKALKLLLGAQPDLSVILHLVGDGPMRNKLTKLLDELEISKHVVFHGWKSSEEIRTRYQNADLYLLPSRSEALPTVLLEAQSCGLPILATDVGSVRDMLPEGNIIVNSGSEDSLAQGMTEMLSRRKEWETLGNRNRNHVMVNYDAASILEKLLTLYNEYHLKG
ncbi:MAG: glycosyltransferase family 4 protein [Flavobacteriaceae bacterium]|nr:glycosyltransferase family 4 protein [Flavobacteriaceae bacterium]